MTHNETDSSRKTIPKAIVRIFFNGMFGLGTTLGFGLTVTMLAESYINDANVFIPLWSKVLCYVQYLFFATLFLVALGTVGCIALIAARIIRGGLHEKRDSITRLLFIADESVDFFTRLAVVDVLFIIYWSLGAFSTFFYGSSAGIPIILISLFTLPWILCYALKTCDSRKLIGLIDEELATWKFFGHQQQNK